jgi:zinc transport system substrate-binding protein
MIHKRVGACGVVMMLGWGCGGSSSPEPAEVAAVAVPEGPLEVRTASFPVDWLTERVAGDKVSRQRILPDGEDAGKWHPSGVLVAGLAEVDLIVANGAGLEVWMNTASLPENRVLYSADGADLIELGVSTHSHGDGEHSHAEIDPHTWLDPMVLAHQAEAIRTSLIIADPSHAQSYAAAFSQLEEELVSLDRAMSDALGTLKGSKVATDHSGYNYLARRYGLMVRAFDLDAGTPPAEAEVDALIAWTGLDPAPVMLWRTPPSDAVVDAFPDEVQHLVVDPLDQPVQGRYDYLLQARANLESFRKFARSVAPEEAQ